MMFLSMALILLPVASLQKSAMQTVSLQAQHLIQKSCKIQPKEYRIAAPDDLATTGAIVIRGNNIVVDFQGAVLLGSEKSVQPDQRQGTGIYVEGKNIVILNAKIQGFKVGILARNAPGIRIVNCDTSYNWKQHLLSTEEKEDGADWMSYHQNEKDEWLRYGAGIYLEDCNGFEVVGNRSVGGQNALMMTRCNKGRVWNNNFSFNSSLGIGMYRSSNNKIMHNKVDWCVRGYSHGVYNRGQDSAGILIYEQSNENLFAYNSVTHGGDGFFLWAGQSTMDTAKGGCNDNLLYGNDFSHAPTNGIEATFSRNTFANNLIMECWHGIWGGYSYETNAIGNYFAYNAEAVALEHGQDNSFLSNVFFRDNTVLNIWQNASQDPNWGYPKNRDTRSRDYRIEGNSFVESPGFAYNIRDTLNFKVTSNSYTNMEGLMNLSGNLAGFDSPEITMQKTTYSSPDTATHSATEEIKVNGAMNLTGKIASYMAKGTGTSLPKIMQPSGNLVLPYPDGDAGYSNRFQTNWNPLKNTPRQTIYLGAEKAGRKLPAVPNEALQLAPKPFAGAMDPFIPNGARRGRKFILVDEWGPYDFLRPIFARPKLNPKLSNSKIQTYEGEIWGPKGQWQVVSSVNCNVTPEKGVVGSKVRIDTKSGSSGNYSVIFEFVGAQVTDHRGITTKTGVPYRFSWSKFEIGIDWTVQWFDWDLSKVSDPKAKMPSFEDTVRLATSGTPVATTKTTKLDFVTGGSPFPGVPDNHFLTLAEGDFTIPKGEYEIGVTADDGIRLYLDGKLLIEEWHWQGPTRYTKVVSLNGKHHLRAEHYEIDGYTALKVDMAPKR